MNEPSSLNFSGSSFTNWAPSARWCSVTGEARTKAVDRRPPRLVAVDQLRLEGVDALVQGPAVDGHPVLDGLELPGDAVQLVDVEIGQRTDLIGPQHRVELGGELRLLGVGGEELGQVRRPGRAARPRREDAREVVDQVAEVTEGVRARVLEVGVDDVEAALDEAAEVGQGHLGLLALGAHGPDVGQGPLPHVVEVAAGQNAVEVVLVAWHQARWYSPGRARGPLPAGGAYR